MKLLSKILSGLRALFKTVRLALPKIGVGWMFALLTINFNRITIYELDVVAVVVGIMLAMHYVLSPFQVIIGRIADRYPIFGLRRTPYMLIGATVGSLVFLALPRVAHYMGAGEPLAYVAGFGLLTLFGVAIAIMGDTHHSLIAEVTTPRARGGVISVVWTFSIMSTIMAAGVMNSITPEFAPSTVLSYSVFGNSFGAVIPQYSLDAMQALYNLTPFIVIGAVLLGIVGMEKRLNKEELAEKLEQAKAAAPGGNPLAAATQVLQQNRQALGFFAFIFVAILAIFLQDNILEPYGAEVFGMSQQETNMFQPMWGGGVLIGMAVMGLISTFFYIPKRRIALIGTIGAGVGMGGLATASLLEIEAAILPVLMAVGFFTGFFNVGALSMMMDMTVEGATGLFMGLWGMAQAFGNAFASVGGTGLHTLLIETGFLTPNAAYFTIYGIEALGMFTAAVILWNLSVNRFHKLHEATLTRKDTIGAMEAGVAA